MQKVKLNNYDELLANEIIKAANSSIINANVVVVVFKRTNKISVGSNSMILERTSTSRILTNRLHRLIDANILRQIEKQESENIYKVLINPSLIKKRKNVGQLTLSF